MEKFDHRRFGKSRKTKKKDHKHESKLPKKKRDDKLFAGLKKHQTAHDVLHKITSGRLTVRHGIFQNAIRSDIVTKEQTSLLRDDDRAVLNEDLFKLLDIADRDTKRLKQNNTKTNRVCSDFDRSHINQSIIDIIPTEQQEEEEHTRSIFQDIEEQYNNITIHNNNIENHCDSLDKDNHSLLVEDELLRQFVYKYVHGPVTDAADKYCKEKLSKLCTEDPAKTQVESFLKELSNKQPTREDIQVNCSDCNMNTPPGAYGYLPPAADIGQPVLPMEVERCRTPDNQPVSFPEASYHTPENQKYIQHPDTTGGTCKYEAGIYVVPNDYRSAIRDDHLLQEQLDAEFSGRVVNNQPVLYHVNTREFNFTGDPELPVDVSRLEKRPLNDTDLFERPSKQFKFEEKRPINDPFDSDCERPSKQFKFDDANMFERPSKQFKYDFPVEKDVESHSLVYSRPKKIYTSKNKFTSPAESEEFYPRQPESRRKLSYSYSSQPVMEVCSDPVPLVQKETQCATFKGFRKPKYSPRDCRRERIPFKTRFSPNELNLRKKYAPQTLRIDEMDENTPPPTPFGMELDLEDIPRGKGTPDIAFKPRFN